MPYLWCSIDPRGGNLSFSLALFTVLLLKGGCSPLKCLSRTKRVKAHDKDARREGRTSYRSSPGYTASVSYRGSWFPLNRTSLSPSAPLVFWPVSSSVALKYEQRCELCKPKCMSFTSAVWVTVIWLTMNWLYTSVPVLAGRWCLLLPKLGAGTSGVLEDVAAGPKQNERLFKFTFLLLVLVTG